MSNKAFFWHDKCVTTPMTSRPPWGFALAMSRSCSVTSWMTSFFLCTSPLGRRQTFRSLPGAGWHITYFMTIDQMVSKVNNFVHAYDFPPERRHRAWLERCVAEGIDVLSREMFVESEVPAQIAASIQGDADVARLLQNPDTW